MHLPQCNQLLLAGHSIYISSTTAHRMQKDCAGWQSTYVVTLRQRSLTLLRLFLTLCYLLSELEQLQQLLLELLFQLH